MGGLNIFDLIIGQFTSIPTDNLLGIVYVVLNAIMLLFATFFGGETLI